MPPTSTTPALAPYLEAQRSSRTAALLIFTLLLGPLSLLGGSILYGVARLLNRRWLWLALAAMLVGGMLWAGWHWETIRDDGLALWAAVQPLGTALRQTMAQARRPTAAAEPTGWWPLLQALGWAIWGVWRWGLLGIPLVALYLNGTRLKTAAEQEQARLQHAAQTVEHQSQRAARRSENAPLSVRKQLVLGAPVVGDLAWTQRGWVVYPPDVLGRHLVLIGASGQGKSETALRLAAGAKAVYGWQVFFLDAKGDRAMAERFAAAMQNVGVRRFAQIPERAFDGWRGDATALLNRLLSTVEFTEPYYRDITKMVLSLTVDAPQGPPRSSQALLNRLRLDTLRELYADHPDERELDGLQNDQVAATYNRYRAFFRALRGQLDGDWAWEDVDAGYLLLDGLALKDQAVSLGRYLLEDFAHYVATRKDSSRRVLLIVDEFSALAIGGTDAASLFERVRSYSASVVVTSQSYAGLGQGADRILGAAATVLLHQCPDPETLIARAGTAPDVLLRRSAVERLGLGGVKSYATGQVAYAETDRFKVRPEVVQQLQPGECVAICGGDALRLRVSQLRLNGGAPQRPPAQPVLAQPPRRVTRIRTLDEALMQTAILADGGAVSSSTNAAASDTSPGDSTSTAGVPTATLPVSRDQIDD
jgi:hypothetical protein